MIAAGPLTGSPITVAPLVRVSLTNEEYWLSIGIAQADIDRGFMGFSNGALFSNGTGFALPDNPYN